LREQLVGRLAELLGGVLREVDQPPFGVGGPDPSDPGLFEVVEDLQPSAGIAGPDDRCVADVGRIFGRVRPATRQALEDTPYRHVSPVAAERPAPRPSLCADCGLFYPNARRRIARNSDENGNAARPPRATACRTACRRSP